MATKEQTATKYDQTAVNNALWAACDTFRGVLSSEQYKNYILTAMFLKYVSDVWDDHKAKYEKQFDGNAAMVESMMANENIQLPKESHFSYLYDKRDADNLGELFDIALAQLEKANPQQLDGIFSDISFNSETMLGKTKDRNRRLRNLLEDFHKDSLDFRPSHVGDEDVIGNAYMYMIERFAAGGGKKGGEYYTPPGPSRLLAKLMSPEPGAHICDPMCGSGSLLIQTGRETRDLHGEHSDNYKLWGQEVNRETYNLARLNMFMHKEQNNDIQWGDTLSDPKFLQNNSLRKFDVLVANPPFSLDKWGDPDDAKADPYNRFHRGVPPKSKGDYAFISHMVESMSHTGRMAVIVPHGVLFRGGAEAKIRKQMIEDDLLDAVIGLPNALFYGTGIPVAVLVFDKRRVNPDDDGNTLERKRDILFIDSSTEGNFLDGKKQNQLRTEDIDRIIDTYHQYKTIDKYSYRATIDEVKENDYNLNISRYVDTFEEPEPIDLPAVQAEIRELDEQLAQTRSELAHHLKALGLEV